MTTTDIGTPVPGFGIDAVPTTEDPSNRPLRSRTAETYMQDLATLRTKLTEQLRVGVTNENLSPKQAISVAQELGVEAPRYKRTHYVDVVYRTVVRFTVQAFDEAHALSQMGSSQEHRYNTTHRAFGYGSVQGMTSDPQDMIATTGDNL